MNRETIKNDFTRFARNAFFSERPTATEKNWREFQSEIDDFLEQKTDEFDETFAEIESKFQTKTEQ